MVETHRLIELRRAAGMSQRALAAALGIKPAYMCEIETRRDSVPDHLFTKLPAEIRGPLVRARIGELRKLIVTDHLGRDEKDFAIEHAGYLADSVERMLQAQRSIIDAEEWLELHSLAYEFRKRIARIAELEKLL